MCVKAPEEVRGIEPWSWSSRCSEPPDSVLALGDKDTLLMNFESTYEIHVWTVKHSGSVYGFRVWTV